MNAEQVLAGELLRANKGIRLLKRKFQDLENEADEIAEERDRELLARLELERRLKDETRARMEVEERLTTLEKSLLEARDTIDGMKTRIDTIAESLTCVACASAMRNSALKCGHMVLCSECLGKLPRKACPVCRKRFTAKSVTAVYHDIDIESL